MATTNEKPMTERERAEEKVRAIVEEPHVPKSRMTQEVLTRPVP